MYLVNKLGSRKNMKKYDKNNMNLNNSLKKPLKLLRSSAKENVYINKKKIMVHTLSSSYYISCIFIK